MSTATRTDPRADRRSDQMADWLDRGLLRGRRRLAALVVTAVVVALLVVAVAWLAIDLRSEGETSAAGRDAVSAANAAVTRMLSYNAGTVDQTVAAANTVTTGAFHDDFLKVLDQVVKPNAQAQNASSTARIMSSGVVTASPTRVVALLMVDQSTRSTKLQGERIDTIEARVTMTEVDGRWLVSGLDQL